MPCLGSWPRIDAGGGTVAANDRHRPYQSLLGDTGSSLDSCCGSGAQSHRRLADNGRVEAGLAAAVRAASLTLVDVVVSAHIHWRAGQQQSGVCLPKGLVT